MEPDAFTKFLQASIRIRLEFIEGLMQENLRNIAQWNDKHPQDVPVDCETERVVLQNIYKAKECLEAGDMAAMEWFNQKVVESLEAARAEREHRGLS